MLTLAETETMAIMKKSLFRLTDVLELGVAYAFCFSLNLMFDYVKTIELTSGSLANRSYFSDCFCAEKLKQSICWEWNG